MPLATRPAARFFAAFYRWNCSAKQSPNCRRLALRCYSATRPLGRNNGAKQSEESGPRIEGASAAETIEPTYAHLKTAIRELMRNVPSTVTVITVHGTEPGIDRVPPIGSSISSLSTITLDPPHISFNIKTPSRTLDAIQKSQGRFRVHILEATQEGALIANEFTRGNSHDVLLQRSRSIELHPSQSPPSIRSEAVLASMECQLLQEVNVADHIVAIARVDHMESRKRPAPALLYHNGSYKKCFGRHLANFIETSSRKNAGSPSLYRVFYSYPWLIGQIEKKSFTSLIKQYLKQKSEVLKQDYDQIEYHLRDNSPPWQVHFGILIPQLVDQCRVEIGLPADTNPNISKSPAECRFYGHLSPADIATIVGQAKTLVRANPSVLNFTFKQFLTLLGVHYRSQNLLPSDILNALRKDGLAPSFAMQSVEASYIRSADDPGATIEKQEQIEFQLRKRLETLSYSDVQAGPQSLNDLLSLQSSYAKSVSNIMLSRLVTDAFPDAFSGPGIDITGHVTPQGGRVIVQRLVELLVHNSKVAPLEQSRTNAFLPKYELFRRIHVHPMVSGVDISYIFAKMRYMINNTVTMPRFRSVVYEHLEPLLPNATIEAEEVRSRVKKLVDTHALQLATWSISDLRAAIGIGKNAKVAGSQDDLTHIGIYLTPVIIEELEARLAQNRATPEERDAIIACRERLQNPDDPVLGNFIINGEVDGDNPPPHSHGDAQSEAVIRNQGATGLFRSGVYVGKRRRKGAAEEHGSSTRPLTVASAFQRKGRYIGRPYKSGPRGALDSLLRKVDATARGGVA